MSSSDSPLSNLLLISNLALCAFFCAISLFASAPAIFSICFLSIPTFVPAKLPVAISNQLRVVLFASCDTFASVFVDNSLLVATILLVFNL